MKKFQFQTYLDKMSVHPEDRFPLDHKRTVQVLSRLSRKLGDPGKIVDGKFKSNYID